MNRTNYLGNPEAFSLNGQPARFCRSCCQTKSLEGGTIVVPKSKSRFATSYWRCKACNERRSPRQLERHVEIVRT